MRRSNFIWRAAMACVLAVSVLGCGGDEAREQGAPSSLPVSPSSRLTDCLDGASIDVTHLASTWRLLLSPAAFASRPGDEPIAVRLADGREQRRLLEQVRLEQANVRKYVADIVNIGLSTSEMYGADDPVVGALALLGPEHCSVLLEPLVLFDHFNGDIWLVAAIQRVADEPHKDLILDALLCAPELLDVVIEEGWSDAAAARVVSEVQRRSPDTPADWIVFSARYFQPSDYSHLRWHLVHGRNPLYIWNGIRDIVAPEELRPMLHEAWRGTNRQREFGRWGQLVVAAAQSGDAEALGELAHDMPEGRIHKGREVFRALTGFEGDSALARRWFETHAATLQFNPTKGTYTAD